MEQATPEVRMTVDDHVCVISLDNVAKKNAITPELMAQLSLHLTKFEDDDDLWVAILDPAGEHTTAGLDMPKFFGPGATAKPLPEDQVDPFALQRRTTKPVISVVHGITWTIGIEMMLAGDIVIAADTARFCQLESKRGIAPFGGAHWQMRRAISSARSRCLPYGCTSCTNPIRSASCASNSSHRKRWYIALPQPVRVK